MKKNLPFACILLCLAVLLQLAFIEKPLIESPSDGDVLQGSVTVKGSVNVIGFKSFEVYFGYDGDSTNTWFLLEQGEEAVQKGVLTVWDTTQITDGNYRIMVRVNVEDSQPIDIIIPGLRVRNYTTVETSTPAPKQSETQLDASQTGQTPAIETTKLPDNPAEITIVSLLKNIVKGIGIALLILLVIAAFLYVRGRPR